MAKIVIVGAGVVGLTVAYELLNEKGSNHRITIVASQIPMDWEYNDNYTSPFAGANWASFAGPNDIRQQNIDEVGYSKFKKLAETKPEAGIIKRVDQNYVTYDRFKAWGNKIRLPWLKRMKEINFRMVDDYDKSLYRYSYAYDGFVISTTHYLTFLWNECVKSGRFELRRKKLHNLDEAYDLHHDGGKADIVINCSGIGARELVPDSGIYGVRGVLLLVQNDVKLDKIIGIKNVEPTYKDEGLYIMPRQEGDMVIGGCFQVGKEYEKTVSDAQCQRMLARAVKYLPWLPWKDFKIIRKQVGFRPFRKGGLRIEYDKEKKSLIHCYGHGGAGYQASWGSSAIVRKLVKDYLADNSQKRCCKL